VRGLAGFEMRGDPSRPESMVADPDARAEIGGTALDHAPASMRCMGFSVEVSVRPVLQLP
jgi:hypothetical protein